MKHVMAALAASMGMFMTGAYGQHEGHQQGQAAPETGKMMSVNMMAGMEKPAMGQDQTAKLADELQKSLAAIQAEQDPAALKEKLAAHGALLTELQKQLQARPHTMEGKAAEKSDSMKCAGGAGGASK